MTERQIKRGVHRSTAQLQRVITEFIATHNVDPTPFAWTKSDDDILASIARLCSRTLASMAKQLMPRLMKRISESGH